MLVKLDAEGDPPLVSCRQHTGPGDEHCGAEGVAVILWPGASEWCPVCQAHFSKAVSVALTLGFVLPVQLARVADDEAVPLN